MEKFSSLLKRIICVVSFLVKGCVSYSCVSFNDTSKETGTKVAKSVYLSELKDNSEDFESTKNYNLLNLRNMVVLFTLCGTSAYSLNGLYKAVTEKTQNLQEIPSDEEKIINYAIDKTFCDIPIIFVLTLLVLLIGIYYFGLSKLFSHSAPISANRWRNIVEKKNLRLNTLKETTIPGETKNDFMLVSNNNDVRQSISIEKLKEGIKKIANTEEFFIIGSSSAYLAGPGIDLVEYYRRKGSVQCIVNAANEECKYGSNVTGTIFDNFGKDEMLELTFEDLKKHANKPNATKRSKVALKPGETILTQGVSKNKKEYWQVIHAYGPIKKDNNGNEILASAYLNILNLAKKNNIRSVAVVPLSTGEFGYKDDEDKKVAAEIAIGITRKWLMENSDYEMCIVFLNYDQVCHRIYRDIKNNNFKNKIVTSEMLNK